MSAHPLIYLILRFVASVDGGNHDDQKQDHQKCDRKQHAHCARKHRAAWLDALASLRAGEHAVRAGDGVHALGAVNAFKRAKF